MSRKYVKNEDSEDRHRTSKVEPIKVFDLEKMTFDIKCKNESQKNLLKLINENDVVICSGPAGTGKTFIACAQALKLLKSNKKYNKILLIKSVTELEGESVGYLKGSLAEKLFPYTLSFLDNFHKIIGEENTQQMLANGMIEVLPLAYIRGRSIDNAIIIVDEAQNISLKNMRSTLTRIGENSKMIITGDSKQIDIKNKRLSSLDTVVHMFSNRNGIGTMNFLISDIVRSPIVRMIEEVFDDMEENEKNTKK